MNNDFTICIIGAGHLGTGLIKRLLERGHEKVIATRRSKGGLEKLKNTFSALEITADNQSAVERSDIIIIATKQTSFEDISEEIKELRKGKLLISVGPTCTLKKLHELFGGGNVRIITPVTPDEDIVCFTMDGECSEKDAAMIRYIFGENTYNLPEREMSIATTYVLFRGVLNSFFDPLRSAGVEAGLSDQLARKVLGRMLVSTGKEVEKGMDANDRLENASGGFNESSFTLKLYKDMQPAQESLEALFKKTCEGFKKAESDS